MFICYVVHSLNEINNHTTVQVSVLIYTVSKSPRFWWTKAIRSTPYGKDLHLIPPAAVVFGHWNRNVRWRCTHPKSSAFLCFSKSSPWMKSLWIYGQSSTIHSLFERRSPCNFQKQYLSFNEAYVLIHQRESVVIFQMVVSIWMFCRHWTL